MLFTGVRGAQTDNGITDDAIETTPVFTSSLTNNVLQTGSNHQSNSDTNRNRGRADGHQSGDLGRKNYRRTYHRRFELDSDIRTELVNFVNRDVNSGMPPGQLSKITALADQLALNVTRIRDEAAFSEMEWQEMCKRKKNLIFYNIQESKSKTHAEHIAHDARRIREFLRNCLRFDDLEILYLKRFPGNPGFIKINVQNEHIVDRILVAQTAMTDAGKKFDIFCTRDRSPLDHICNQQLRLQAKVRNKISEFRSNPWRWRNVKSKTVPSLPNTLTHNVVHMEELAEEIKYLVRRLKLLVRDDSLEMQQRMENLKYLLIYNVEESHCGSLKERQAQDEHKVKMICDFLETDFSKVAKVVPVNWERPEFAPLPLRVTFTDSTVRHHLLERAPLLKESLVPWMQPVFLGPQRTTVQRYTNTLLLQELSLRNEIFKRKEGEDGEEWTIIGEEVRLRSSKFVSPDFR